MYRDAAQRGSALTLASQNNMRFVPADPFLRELFIGSALLLGCAVAVGAYLRVDVVSNFLPEVFGLGLTGIVGSTLAAWWQARQTRVRSAVIASGMSNRLLDLSEPLLQPLAALGAAAAARCGIEIATHSQHLSTVQGRDWTYADRRLAFQFAHQVAWRPSASLAPGVNTEPVARQIALLVPHLMDTLERLEAIATRSIAGGLEIEFVNTCVSCEDQLTTLLNACNRFAAPAGLDASIGQLEVLRREAGMGLFRILQVCEAASARRYAWMAG